MARFRFSLKMAFVGLVMAALAAGWISAVLRQQETERRYRLLTSTWQVDLPIRRPNQLHFRRLDESRLGTNQWRVYVPDDRPYELCYGVGTSVDPWGRAIPILKSLPLKPGYSVIEVEWHVDLALHPSVAWGMLEEQSQQSRRELLTLPPEYVKNYRHNKSHAYTYAAPGAVGVATNRDTVILFQTNSIDPSPTASAAGMKTSPSTPASQPADAAESPAPNGPEELTIWIQPAGMKPARD
ncbi:MAG: hypothetical protein U0939_13450 [Pirellulales bacterium]